MTEAAAALEASQKPEPDEGEPFHAFLADVRNRATTSLMACGLTTDGDPADIHEDVREALIEFFEEIRQRVEGPLCDLPVMIGLNAFAVCDLLLGHGGPHHPCLGTPLAGRPE